MHMTLIIMMWLISIVGYFVAKTNKTTTLFWLIALVANTCSLALVLIMPVLLHL